MTPDRIYAVAMIVFGIVGLLTLQRNVAATISWQENIHMTFCRNPRVLRIIFIIVWLIFIFAGIFSFCGLMRFSGQE